MNAVACGPAARFPGDTFASRWLAVAAILMFYSGLAIYGTFALWSLVPLFWILLLFGAFLATAWIGGATRLPVDTPVAIWCLVYSCLSMVSYVSLMGGDSEPLRKRLLGAAFLMVCFLLFSQGPAVLRFARRTMAVVVVVSVLLNVYDISHPFAFVPAGNEFSNVGRAAGIYINANGAGMAIVLGMVLSVGVVPRWLRGPFVALAIVGVLLTFSRGAMLSLFLALVLLWRDRELNFGAMATAIVTLLLISVVGYIVLLPLIESFHLDVDTLLRRFFYFFDPSSGVDYSQIERQRVAARAWDLVATSPFIGHGVGTTELWGDIGTHNTYVMLGADFGVLGVVAYPVLAWLSCRRARGPWLGCALAFLVVLLINGLFDHDILTSYALLLPIALMAAMSQVADQADPSSAGQLSASGGRP